MSCLNDDNHTLQNYTHYACYKAFVSCFRSAPVRIKCCLEYLQVFWWVEGGGGKLPGCLHKAFLFACRSCSH